MLSPGLGWAILAILFILSIMFILSILSASPNAPLVTSTAENS
jgi:hypothetical protein